MLKYFIRYPICFFVLYLSFHSNTLGQTGSLDPSFGNGGIVKHGKGTTAYSHGVAIQNDGKILMLSKCSGDDLIRYNEDGKIDSSFGDNGIVSVNVDLPLNGSLGGVGNHMIILESGNIIVCGTYGYKIALEKFYSNGKVDSSFGTSGIKKVNIEKGPDRVGSIAYHDNKIVVAGGVGSQGFIARLDTNGKIDPTFNVHGRLFINVGGEYDIEGFSDVCIDNNNRIVACGSAYINDSSLLVRLNWNGDFDTSFNHNGILLMNANSSGENLYSIAVGEDNKIFATGECYDEVGYNWLLIRSVLENSNIDSSFGDDGVIKCIPSGIGKFILVKNPNEILVAAMADYNAYIIRLDSIGQFWESFGDSGVFGISLGYEDLTSGCALDQQGRIIVSGHTEHGCCNDTLFMARVLDSDVVTAFILSDTQSEIKIFPNPVSKQITISVSSNETILLSIFNLLGEKVKEEKVSGSGIIIDVSELPMGMYVVRRGEQTIGKFLKQ